MQRFHGLEEVHFMPKKTRQHHYSTLQATKIPPYVDIRSWWKTLMPSEVMMFPSQRTYLVGLLNLTMVKEYCQTSKTRKRDGTKTAPWNCQTQSKNFMICIFIEGSILSRLKFRQMLIIFKERIRGVLRQKVRPSNV